MSQAMVDLTGRRFGKLIVAWPIGHQQYTGTTRRIAWLCFCDCGKTRIYNAQELLRQDVSNKSCGCNRRNAETALHCLFLQYKGKARQRGYCWELSFDNFKRLVKSPCYYTGWLPQQIYYPSGINPSPSFTYNGIDRRDNSKGYTIENCVPCSGQVNRAKMNSSEEDFVFMCYSVVENLKSRGDLT